MDWKDAQLMGAAVAFGFGLILWFEAWTAYRAQKRTIRRREL